MINLSANRCTDVPRGRDRTIDFHRGQIRRSLGFRECSVADTDKFTEWLVTNVTQAERAAERVREELLARCRAERIEPPTGGRIDRVVRSALYCGGELPNPPRPRLQLDRHILVSIENDSPKLKFGQTCHDHLNGQERPGPGRNKSSDSQRETTELTGYLLKLRAPTAVLSGPFLMRTVCVAVAGCTRDASTAGCPDRWCRPRRPE